MNYYPHFPKEFNYEPSEFKAYLVKRNYSQAALSRRMHIDTQVFNSRVNKAHYKKSVANPKVKTRLYPSYAHFSENEILQIIKILEMAEKDQITIFGCVLVPRKAGK